MKKTSKKIVFFGSGPVAAKALELLAQDFLIEAVVTKPRPPHHRGNAPVVDLATKLGLPILLASTKRELDLLFEDKPVNSNLGVLIDFGIIVSQKIIDTFPLGIINSHFSILPEWRGADPITFAVLSGQKKTGVSLMLLVEKMDEGPLLDFAEYTLLDQVTTPGLTEALIELSHHLLVKNIPAYLDGSLKPKPQTITKRAVSYSRKLTKNDGILDFTKTAMQLDREIRAFVGWPQSRTQIAGKDVVITKAHSVPVDGKPGKIEALDKKSLIIYCGSGYLCIERLKPAGKPEMDVVSFLAGYGKSL
ncbi:MAG TPA: methionyl-tRNA formyltransferase [Candidatus Saccharibacteria bacterium]|nr:methionyl-tRNA formyltransferase [Candidatus Saccharibacteria bacterium]